MHVQNLLDLVDSVQHVFAVFQGFPVVGGYIGLALGHVNNQGVDAFAIGHVQLYMGRKARAAQSHQPGGPGGVGQGFFVFDRGRRLNGRVRLHQPVGLNDHRLHHLPGGQHNLGDLRHRAGDGSMDGRAHIGLGIAYHSAHIHMVPFFHRGLAGRANVLLHSQNDLLGGRHNLGRILPGILMVGHRSAAVGTEWALGKLILHD